MPEVKCSKNAKQGSGNRFKKKRRRKRRRRRRRKNIPTMSSMPLIPALERQGQVDL